MGFEVSADAYDRFMGRFSTPLAARFVAEAGIGAGLRVLDVGSGPGALTGALAATVGADHVVAVDPMPVFVESLQERHPGVAAQVAPAERLPFSDGEFDAALAALVVPFMADPVAGLCEMVRVTRPGGTVAATVWQHAAGTSPLSPFWDGVRDVDPTAVNESVAAGTREGHLAELFADAGIPRTRTTELTVTIEFERFDDWWEPFTYGVGPAGGYVAARSPERVAEVRAACAARLGPEPFTVSGSAWCVVGTRP
jgi:SAM-dependent methyltransferase